MKTILVDAAGTFTVNGQTNANDEQLPKFGLVNLPYPIFTLKHNPDKDNPVYFQQMLAHFERSVGDVVYFEHAPEAVVSAQSVGITSYLFDSEKRDMGKLKEFLDENCM